MFDVRSKLEVEPSFVEDVTGVDEGLPRLELIRGVEIKKKKIVEAKGMANLMACDSEEVERVAGKVGCIQRSGIPPRKICQACVEEV